MTYISITRGLTDGFKINYQVFEPQSVRSVLSGIISFNRLTSEDGKTSYVDGKFSFIDGEQSIQFTVSEGFIRGEINAQYGFMCWSSSRPRYHKYGLESITFKSEEVNTHDNELTGSYQGIGFNPLSTNSNERVVDVYIYIKKDIAGTHLIFQDLNNDPLLNIYPRYTLLPRSSEDEVLKFLSSRHDVISLVLTDGILRGTISRGFAASYSFVCKPSPPIY